MDKIEEFFDLIEQSCEMFSEITQSIFDREILFKKDTHKVFAIFIVTLIKRVIKKGYISDYFKLSQVLMEFSDRFLYIRFTSKQLDEYEILDSKNLQQKKILDYFKQIDDVGKINTKNPDELKKKVKKLRELWKVDPLPDNWVDHQDELNESLKDPIKFKEFSSNLLSKLAQAYETFTLFSLFLLILFRKLNSHTCKKEEKHFLKGSKLKVTQLYKNDKKSNTSPPLLREYLSSEFPKIPQLIEIFDWVFREEGIRGIRNLAVHNLGEKGKCEILDDRIILFFKENEPKEYSYKKIADIYRQIQFFIYLIVFNNYEMFLRVLEFALKNFK